MNTYQPDPFTVAFASLFTVIYLGFLLKKTLHEKVDLYDFVLLSTVALCPSALLYFPELSLKVTHSLGVAFPFVLLFGFLFLIVFIFLNRFVAIGKSNERKITTLVQELAILKASLKENESAKTYIDDSRKENTSDLQRNN